jgi:hypothetical protein
VVDFLFILGRKDLWNKESKLQFIRDEALGGMGMIWGESLRQSAVHRGRSRTTIGGIASGRKMSFFTSLNYWEFKLGEAFWSENEDGYFCNQQQAVSQLTTGNEVCKRKINK